MERLNRPEVVVLGAGPAGIGAALSLGSRALLLERAEAAGGVSGSIEFEGAVFDIGGHSFHTPHPHIRQLVEEAVELYEQQRDARCFSHGHMLPYPFQKHFRDIPNESVVRACAEGLPAIPASAKAGNFSEFIERRFGAGISRHFLRPYNEKLWGANLARLAAEWVGERVAAPEGVEETFDERGGKRKPLQPGTRVAYPARGGFGSIMTALAQRLPNVRYGQNVTRIDLRARRLSTAGGQTYPFGELVSSLPLPVLVQLCGDVPPEVRRAVNQLECLSLKVILLVVGHPVDTPIQRIYCADQTVPAHKIAINHNSSPYLRALPHHGIMAEVSCANGVEPDDVLVRWTVAGLQQMGVLNSPADVVATRVLSVKYAYPVPTLARDVLVTQALEWLKLHHIHTVGRFGEWAYINSDEALHRGVRLGAAL
jgi:protoporphyrinogen oxidase